MLASPPLVLDPPEVFEWRDRVEAERQLRNITFAHQKVLVVLADLVQIGDADPPHEELARFAKVSLRTTRDALRRGKLLGLMAWEQRYCRDPATGLRRQQSNRYRWTLPKGPAVARPDVRRQHRDCTLCRAGKKEDSDKQIAYERHVSPAIASLDAIRQRMEVDFADRWRAARLFDSG
jgi:hypothetical protein